MSRRRTTHGEWLLLPHRCADGRSWGVLFICDGCVEPSGPIGPKEDAFAYAQLIASDISRALIRDPTTPATSVFRRLTRTDEG